MTATPNTRSHVGTNRDKMGPKVPCDQIVEPSVPVGHTPLALTDEAIPMHGLRCSCADCLAERSEIRRVGLVHMRATPTEKADRWADVSWDDPVNRFPGAGNGAGDDTDA